MAKLKWTVEIEIDEMWVADGANLTTERMQSIMENAFGWLRPDEVRAKTISAPPDEVIAQVQGFKSVEEFHAANKRGR